MAGISGSGKSVFLRLLAYQAIADDLQLSLSDLDGATFPMLAGHPALSVLIAYSPAGALSAVRSALLECDRRKSLYQAHGVENLEEYNRVALRAGEDPLPRQLVILDEYGATVTAAGGPEGDLSLSVAQLEWRRRKFGIHLILAAQDISKAIVGKVRDHVRPIAFRLQSHEVARALGCQQALRIIPAERPGLAITPWGALQTYYLDRAAFGTIPAAGLDNRGAELASRAIQETGGRMSIPILVGRGLTERQARELLDGWEQRGWAKRDPKQNNARYITPVLAEILSNRQTRQALSNG